MKNKTINRINRIGQTTVEVLQELHDVTNAFLGSACSTRLFYQILRENHRISSKRISEKLNYLNKRGYVKLYKHKNKISIKLTEKGRIKLLENSNYNQIDGKWRMISFDIPEEHRARRDRFRSAIKRIGFRQVQKSLWACPFARVDGVERAIRYYQVKDYVAYLIVEKSDIDRHLKNLFKEYFIRKTRTNKKLKIE